MTITKAAAHHQRPTHSRATRMSRSAHLVGTLALMLGLLPAGAPALAQTSTPPAPTVQDKPAAPAAERTLPPYRCRRDEGACPVGDTDTGTITSDQKAIVPRGLMREQADFNLGSAVRQVPGAGVNRK